MYVKEKKDKASRIRKAAYMAAGKSTQKTILTHSDFSETMRNKKNMTINFKRYLSSP
jgi:hypothetical protein